MENYEGKRTKSRDDMSGGGGGGVGDEKRLELQIRLMRQSMLARPPPRAFLPFPDPNLFFIGGKTISQAALVYKPSKRILLLSKFLPRLYSPKYIKPDLPKHCVNPEALVFKPTPRILELAHSMYDKKEAPKKVKKNMKKLRKLKKSIQNRPAWMELRAAPKIIPEPPPLEKFEPKVPLSPEERDERMRIMAEPKHKYEPYEDTFIISRAALKYQPSQRIVEISSPKELNPETVLNITFNPFKIKKSALRYKASERVVILATPNVRKKQEDTDVKENPFSVIPRALTAICTKRVAELAKPIERD